MNERTKRAAPALPKARALLHEDAGLIRSDLWGFSREAGNPDICAKVASFENTVQPIGVVTSVLSNPSTQKMGKLRPRKGEGRGHNDPAH